MDPFKSGSAQATALVALVFALAPITSTAQDLDRHGEVTAVDGQEVTVQLSEGLSISSGTAGTIYTTTTVGGEEQSVPVARVEVNGTEGRTVTAEITNQTQTPEAGFLASFETVRRFGMIDVEVAPTGATISIDGNQVGSGAVRQSLAPGEHVVEAIAEGYESARRVLSVEAGQTREIVFDLQRAAGRLAVEAAPDSARIRIDGRSGARGVVRESLSPGQHEVEVRAGQYAPLDTTVAVRAGSTTRLKVELIRKTGRVAVTTTPESAIVVIGGQRLGSAPVLQTLPTGAYRVTARAQGYESRFDSIKVEEGTVKQVQLTLSPRSSTLRIATEPEGAEVYVDGQLQGQGPITADIEPGRHEVRVVADGYQEQTRRVSTDPDEKNRVDIRLKRRTGILVVRTKPENASVQIDGETAGTPPVEKEMPVGEHQIGATAEGYDSVRKTVELGAGERRQVALSMRRTLEVGLAETQKGPVRNVRVRRKDSLLVLDYKLGGDSDEYDVALLFSADGGATYTEVRGTVSGAVGEDITPGSKTIEWAALRDYPSGLTGDLNRLRIRAEPDGGNGWLYAIGSTVLVGGGATVAAILTGIIGGSGDGGGGGNGGGYPTPPAPPN